MKTTQDKFYSSTKSETTAKDFESNQPVISDEVKACSTVKAEIRILKALVDIIGAIIPSESLLTTALVATSCRDAFGSVEAWLR